MQIASPAELLYRAEARASGHARCRPSKCLARVSCQADSLQRRCRLTAAALFSSAALQLSLPHAPEYCATLTSARCDNMSGLPYAVIKFSIESDTVCFRASPADHTLAIKRAFLEDLLMQEMGSR